MKKTILIPIAILLASCGAKTELIGTLNMISTRNVSTKENYVQIKSYAGDSKHELKKNAGKNLEEAVNNMMRAVAGGEFIMNAKIYKVDDQYAVSGDVWGLATGLNFKGYKKGDRVLWKAGFVKYTGVISNLKDDKEATVIQDENGKIHTVRYDEMQKVE